MLVCLDDEGYEFIFVNSLSLSDQLTKAERSIVSSVGRMEFSLLIFHK